MVNKLSFLILLIIILIIPQAVFGALQVTYIMCNPLGSDTDGEYITIKNTGDSAVDLTGWKFNDGSSHTINTPPKNGGRGSLIIEPGGEIKLANKADKIQGDNVADTVMSLSNSGDKVSLLDSSGSEQAVAQYDKTDVVEGGNCLDGSDSQNTNATSTGTTEQVRIHEVTKYNTVTIQPPQDLHIREIQNKEVLLGGVLTISPELYDATGKVVTDALCKINFGDGTAEQICSNNRHVYKHTGKYAVVVTANKSGLHDTTTFAVNVTEPNIELIHIKESDLIKIKNLSDKNINLDGFTIRRGYASFKFKPNTILLPQVFVSLDASVHHLNKYPVRNKRVVLCDSLGHLVLEAKEENVATEPSKQKVVTELSKEQKDDNKLNEEVINNSKPASSEVAIKTKIVTHTMQPDEYVKPANIPTKNSVIGMRMYEQELDKKQKQTQMSTQKLETNLHDGKNIMASAVLSESSINTFNIKYTWLLAVFGIILVSLLPLLLKRYEDTDLKEQPQSNKHNQSEVAGFYIKELK